MKKLGLVGGMGPESTLDYYSQLTSQFEKKHPHSYPPIIIDSLDVYALLALEGEGKINEMVTMLTTSIESLTKAGAEVAALTANTPHMVFDELQKKSSIPLISILDSTAHSIQVQSLTKVGLLGTGVTMKRSFFKDKLASFGIEAVVPSLETIERVNTIITDELELGIVKPESKQELLTVIAELQSTANIEGIILGCTELPLAISQDDLSLPVFDTVKIHVAELLHTIEN
ncbi:amino acid racemase [Lentilactobacillus sp. Marseille-Q4993]|uniref:aspartate/glutamate racemase family protein n=1 Tax=Lentilactobacillus sp. Marseille-Q4993 TaxID=3039492 RepID=UPI0024BCC5A9|nr:amino acid racemase [Lentilactobacillus sp. Marseille-Q4993]